MRSRRCGSSRSSGRMPRRRSRIKLRSTTTSATPRCARRETGGKSVGNVEDAFKSAARVIEAEYEWPFQSHASMGPACAVVDIKDGKVTLWTGIAEAALHPRRRRANSRPICRRRARDMDARPRLLRPQRRRRRGDGRRLAGESGRQAGARAIYARPRHRLGSERTRLDPSRARRDRRLRRVIAYDFMSKGLLARRRRIPTSSQAVRHAGGPDSRRAR